MAIIQVNLCYLALPVKNWRILLLQSFTARVPLLTATSGSGLGRRCWSSRQCYLHSLCTSIARTGNTQVTLLLKIYIYLQSHFTKDLRFHSKDFWLEKRWGFEIQLKDLNPLPNKISDLSMRYDLRFAHHCLMHSLPHYFTQYSMRRSGDSAPPSDCVTQCFTKPPLHYWYNKTWLTVA